MPHILRPFSRRNPPVQRLYTPGSAMLTEHVNLKPQRYIQHKTGSKVRGACVYIQREESAAGMATKNFLDAGDEGGKSGGCEG